MMRDSHTFEAKSLSDQQFSKLLGISVEAFQSLDRSELFAYINQEGTIEEYFMYIHPGNPPGILEKLNLQPHHFLRFSPQKILTVIPGPPKKSTKALAH